MQKIRKNQPFIIQNTYKTRNRREHPHSGTWIYNKSIANILHNHEPLNAFPLRLGTKQEHLLSRLLFNIVLYASTIMQEKKSLEMGKKRRNKINFTSDRIVNTEHPTESTTKINKELSIIAESEVNIQNSTVFLYRSN